ncbi:hypothetical protein OROGR_027894 [Orobanche gracilis]
MSHQDTMVIPNNGLHVALPSFLGLAIRGVVPAVTGAGLPVGGNDEAAGAAAWVAAMNLKQYIAKIHDDAIPERQYYPPGTIVVGPGERKLYLSIEGPSGQFVKRAKVEIEQDITNQAPLLPVPVSTKGKPTKLHKRKHQIGSLYFDMRQKEMELAERRAKGFLTKAQTQAKYGW